MNKKKTKWERAIREETKEEDGKLNKNPDPTGKKTKRKSKAASDENTPVNTGAVEEQWLFSYTKNLMIKMKILRTCNIYTILHYCIPLGTILSTYIDDQTVILIQGMAALA
jgi:hypothetical protein